MMHQFMHGLAYTNQMKDLQTSLSTPTYYLLVDICNKRYTSFSSLSIYSGFLNNQFQSIYQLRSTLKITDYPKQFTLATVLSTNTLISVIVNSLLPGHTCMLLRFIFYDKMSACMLMIL